MELAEAISFVVGVTVSLLFFWEYKRVERQEENEELLEQLLS